MAPSGRKTALAAALAGVVLYQKSAFVPPPAANTRPVAAAAGAAAMLGASPAFADKIGDAARKLGDVSYDFAKEVDWNNGIFLQAPGKFDALKALTAIDKMMVMGASADPDVLREAARVHHRAIQAIDKDGVTTRDMWDQVNAAIGRLVASVPESQVMDVYDAVKDITNEKVPKYMMSLVNAKDAKDAYKGFLEFKDTVKAEQVKVAATPPELPTSDSIAYAAKKLSDASYPFLKDVNWLSDIYIKPLPGATPQQVLKAVDRTIDMGTKINAAYLASATNAHHKAVGSIDSKGVTSLADYEAVNNGIGHMISSVPTSEVMDVYNAWAGIVDPKVPNMMFNMVDPLHANAAAKAFYEFKDVVKASQR